MVHLLALPLPLLSLVVAVHAAATPRTPIPKPGESIQLLRRAPQAKTQDEWGTWARQNKQLVEAKYGISAHNEKRSTGTNLLVNQDLDSSFYGSIAVGTPAVSYNVILDTGSSDLWLADPSICSSSDCSHIATFNPDNSSSVKVSTSPFSITYGSGFASGRLVSDTVQMAGFSVSNQVFGLCNNVSRNPDLLTPPVSGLLGLAFQTIASSGAMPFWEALASSGAWDSRLMAFQLTRFTNVTRGRSLEPGGSFTMGFVNSSLYTGDIEYNNIPGGQGTYWIQEMTSLSVQGNSISLPSGSQSYAAIDTGTTLVGGPSSAIDAIYEQIPGSRRGTGDYEGYYLYPCDTNVAVTLAFGGKSWPISNADFQVTEVSNSLCLGAFFAIGSGGSAPPWIVGDVFLKNVYSVYRYDPPSVGFAELSAYALSLNGVDLALPTPTIGSVAATVEATSLVKGGKNSASPRSVTETPLVAIMSIVTIAMFLF
ncbi:acid protease [Marasmius fiardii PR-910]|nr:acid protease [Marasmius fiardii PR-910]